MAAQTYTYAQLEGLWINAGGSPALAPVMAAIAEAESGGNPQAVNSQSQATGLWQINLGAGNGKFVPGGAAQATNPAANASAAVAIEKAQGLGAWTTYTSGAYKQFISGSTTPDTNVPGIATLASSSSSSAASTCLVAAPSAGVFGITLAGGGCMVTKSEGRAVLGVLVMMAGGVLVLPGVLLLGAFAFQRPGAQAAAVRVIPGPAGKAVRAQARRQPERHTRPGQPLSESEVRTANANRRRLERERRREAQEAPARGRHAKGRPRHARPES